MPDLSIASAASLTGTTLAEDDLLPVLDVSAASGSKGSRITVGELKSKVLTGGAAAGLTGLGLRSEVSEFDLKLASSEVLTAERVLSFEVGDADRVLTIPATGTAAVLEASNAFTTGSIVASAPSILINQTWNNAAVSFVGMKITAVCTANAFSELFSVYGGPAGTNLGLRVTNAAGAMGVEVPSMRSIDYTWSLNYFVNGLAFGNTKTIEWSTSGAYYDTRDTGLGRDGAGILAQVSSTTAQTLRIYGTYTDASNYERLSIATAAGAYSIKPEAAGTGTLRNLHISGLPTSNPGPGILWNNAGTPAIGT
ncbi:MAG: hypothetical protein B7Z37_16880 [Verrucomicrobia bacterium 12-59-8]|nr:MAG: hypothetical protein B7Z37_16880 [Verrucomicrobia bacterium 12-59-8]